MASENIIYNADGSKTDESGIQIKDASTLSETDKKCPNCGGTMDFDPESGMLHCPFCDYQEVIPKPDDAPETAQELSFADAENKETNCNWGAQKKAVICKSCGAETIYDALDVSSECPYCGSNQVMEAHDKNTIAPGGVVPFQITNETAGKNFKKWIGNKFFCPKLAKDSAKPEAFKGIYLPYWTFDTDTVSSYVAKVGFNHETKDGSYTTYKNYKGVIDNNPDIATKFQQVVINKPSIEECVEILHSNKEIYEIAHTKQAEHYSNIII